MPSVASLAWIHRPFDSRNRCATGGTAVGVLFSLIATGNRKGKTRMSAFRMC